MAVPAKGYTSTKLKNFDYRVHKYISDPHPRTLTIVDIMMVAAEATQEPNPTSLRTSCSYDVAG